MSEMDSVVSPSELIKLAKAYGHDAIAVTDHGVVQAYPDLEAAIAKQKADIKLIFGVEGYLLTMACLCSRWMGILNYPSLHT